MINEKETIALNKNSGGFAIICKTIEVIKDNIHKLLILIAILAAIDIAQEIIDISFTGENSFTEHSSLRALENLKSDIKTSDFIAKIMSIGSMAGIVTYIVLCLTTATLAYFASLAMLLVVDKNFKPIAAFAHILKKSVPLILTTLLYGLILILVYGALFFLGLLLLYVGTLTHASIGILGVALLIALGAYLFIRTTFYAQVCVLQEKYYLESIKLSFKYTSKNVLAISWKLIEMILMLGLLCLLILVPANFIGLEALQKISEYILINVIVTPIFTIYTYKLYKIYKANHG